SFFSPHFVPSSLFHLLFSTHPSPTEPYTLSLHDALPISPLAGTSILASRCPLVATMRMWSGRSSHSTPFRIGRLSSVEAAKATCVTSLCTTPADAFQALSNLTAGKEGNSSRGRPSSLKRERPHSIATRCSPAAER